MTFIEQLANQPASPPSIQPAIQPSVSQSSQSASQLGSEIHARARESRKATERRRSLSRETRAAGVITIAVTGD